MTVVQLFFRNVYVVLFGIYGSKYEVYFLTFVTKQVATIKTEFSRFHEIMLGQCHFIS